MKRLDLYLAESGFSKSRTEAKQLILGGFVSVNGKKITQPAFSVPDEISSETVTVDRSQIKYVSRGGLKLEAALSAFALSPNGKICLDVGASSGGFTDCLLQNGATHVYAVDAGQGQMSPTLLGDERITLIENYNARYMQKSDFPIPPTFATMDVSFISQTLILPSLYDVLGEVAEVVTLIKPQFELTRSALNKKGVVKTESLQKDAVFRVTAAAEAIGFDVHSVITSPIQGGDGNTEYLLHLKKESVL